MEFSRLTTARIILGLSLPQVIALATGAVVFIAALYTGDPAALYGTGLAVRRRAGRRGRGRAEADRVGADHRALGLARKAARQTAYQRTGS